MTWPVKSSRAHPLGVPSTFVGLTVVVAVSIALGFAA